MINKYNDNELLYLISEKNEIAFEILCEKYRPLIINRLQRFRIKSKNFDDFYQECVMILFKCALSYREDKSHTFNKYLDMCVCNRIRTLLRSEKNYFYNVEFVEYDQLDYHASKMDNGVYYILKDKEIREQYLYRHLSIFERKVMDYLNSGYTIEEIASLEKRNCRSIYNAVARLKDKELKVEEVELPMYVSLLSQLEAIIYNLYEKGAKPKEISEELKIDISKVYNALKRIKTKMKNVHH